MYKIVSFGAIAVAGVSAQMSNQEWANQNGFVNWQTPQQTYQSMGVSTGNWGGNMQQQSRGVPAPCGCAQWCPRQRTVRTATKSKKCCKPNPCKKKAKTCTSPPEKVKVGCSSNPVCTHFKFAWTAPASCGQVKQYQIRVQTGAQQAGFIDRELPVIPGHYSSYQVSQRTLQSYPFNLSLNSKVKWYIRAWSEYGWGEWSDSLLGEDTKGRNASGEKPNAPLGGSTCFPPKKWDGYRCALPGSKPFVDVQRSLADGTCNAIVEQCTGNYINSSNLNTFDWTGRPKFQEECCTKIANPPAGCNCPRDWNN